MSAAILAPTTYPYISYFIAVVIEQVIGNNVRREWKEVTGKMVTE